MRLQLLATVDYDLDHRDESKGGFQNGFDMGAHHAVAQESHLQGAAFTGMISYDFQTYVRGIQNGWATETHLQGAAFTGMISYDFQTYVRGIQNGWATEKNGGAWTMGPEDASAEEWAAVQVADSAALVPFAFENEKLYNTSRTGIVVGLMQLQCHDLLFDAGCSNRITTACYAESAGVGKNGMHTFYVAGFYKAMGKYATFGRNDPLHIKP